MYLWIVIAGGVFSFIASMGIGSNDAANAFATSVGSKTLTIKQASIIAVIFETGGAIVMGSHVVDTIRKGIADYECFEDDVEKLMYGCMWVTVSVAGWLFLASYLEMPVSTTHSCVGGMIGMTIALKGTDCVLWYKESDTFPYVGGVSGIVLSWVISPLFSGIIASFLFIINRIFVLRHSYNSNRIIYLYPVLVGITLVINSFFIIYKGAKGLNLDLDLIEALIISFGIGSAGGLLTVPLIPFIKKKVNNKFRNYNPLNYNNYISDTTESSNNESRENNENIIDSLKTTKSQIQKSIINNIHNSAEKFDIRTEEVFKYLQVFSAICDSFSHGANDVANSIGPFATMYIIYTSNNELSKKNDLDDAAYWILAYGGIGIGLGLILYGKKIMYAIGEKLCKITPSRGTCIELGSAIVIITGSRLKIPLSTTHCQVGAECGVALCEKKGYKAINWYVLGKTIFGWIFTCLIVGTTTGILVAQGIYSHSYDDSCDLIMSVNNTNNTTISF